MTNVTGSLASDELAPDTETVLTHTDTCLWNKKWTDTRGLGVGWERTTKPIWMQRQWELK